MPGFAVVRGFTALLPGLALGLGDAATAHAQQPAPVAQAEGPAPPVAAHDERHEMHALPVDPPPAKPDPALRKARGLLAGGIVLTALCGVGFGLAMWATVDRWKRLYGVSGERLLAADAVLLACTAGSIAAIGVGAKRVRALKNPGRVAWTGGLGFRF